MRNSWGGDVGMFSLMFDGMLNPGWRIMAGLRTKPQPPFWRNLPSYKSIMRPGVWKFSATVCIQSIKPTNPCWTNVVYITKFWKCLHKQVERKETNKKVNLWTTKIYIPRGTPAFQNSWGLKLLESTRLPLGKTRRRDRWTNSAQAPGLLAWTREAELSLNENPHCCIVSASNQSLRMN